MLTEADFDAAYGPFVAKWTAILGEVRVKELVTDLTPAIQGLLEKTIEHQHKAGAHTSHTNVIRHGMDTYKTWAGKHGM